MRQLIGDKGESASLALDGELPDREEVTQDLEALLGSLTKDWKQHVDVLDEHDLRTSIKDIAG